MVTMKLASRLHMGDHEVLLKFIPHLNQTLQVLRSSYIANKTQANYKIFSNQTLIARGEREANRDQHVHYCHPWCKTSMLLRDS
jgi:hypothetical protein